MTQEALDRSIAYLASPEAEKSIQADPYWPKWDSPWWHMTLLWELGLADRIPGSAVECMTRVLKDHYLLFFPLTEDELPPGTDPYRGIACHCALGTMYQVLTACKVDVDKELPWIRPWFLEYQLPDGGLNCDEQAYNKPSPKSSIVSTLPPLEAVLLCTPRAFTPEEEGFLDRGAQYLIKHKLFRSMKGEYIRKEWLRLCFPRFYEYDILRGLSFLVRWAKLRNKPLLYDAAAETLDKIRFHFPDGDIRTQRLSYEGEKSIVRKPDGSWGKGEASMFELLTQVSAVKTPSPQLTEHWKTALSTLEELKESGRFKEK